MEILLKRTIRTDKSTIGELIVNGAFECHILEDVDRGLNKLMTLEELEILKKKSITAIPAGKYEVVISFSNRFKKYLPLLISVLGYEGVRIHAGNKSEDTEGCLLTGRYDSKMPDFVSGSRIAFDALFKKLKAVEKKEKIFITII